MGYAGRRDPRAVRRRLLLRRAGHQPLRPVAPAAALDRADLVRLRELPHRVVALVVRRPLLGADTGAPAAALRPGRARRRARSRHDAVLALARAGTHAGPRLDVDLAAVAANVELLARRATGELMAVVKADGFGHGAAAVARTALAHGATRLGVTSIAEALALRADGVDAPVLSWLNPVDADFAAAVAARRRGRGARPRAPRGRRASRRGTAVHLHLDTGLARDGAAPAEWGDLCRAARRAERQGLVRVVGVMGHLGLRRRARRPGQRVGPGPVRLGARDRPGRGAAAAAPAPGRDRRHAHRPAQPPHDVPGRRRPGRHRPVRHHSAAPGAHADRAAGQRPPGARRHAGRLRPHLDRAGGHRARPAARSGTPTGCPRAASGRAEVLVRGRRRPLVGRISMDMAVVDLGAERRGGRRRRHRLRARAATASRPPPSGPAGRTPSSTRSSPGSGRSGVR